MKIKGRDVLFFLLGIFTIFMIETIIDWDGTKESFKNGFEQEMKKIESEK